MKASNIQVKLDDTIGYKFNQIEKVAPKTAEILRKKDNPIVSIPGQVDALEAKKLTVEEQAGLIKAVKSIKVANLKNAKLGKSLYMGGTGGAVVTMLMSRFIPTLTTGAKNALTIVTLALFASAFIVPTFLKDVFKPEKVEE